MAWFHRLPVTCRSVFSPCVAAAIALAATADPARALDYELKRDFVTAAAGARAGQATAVVGAYVIVGVPGLSRVVFYDRLDPNATPTAVKTIISPNAAAGDDFGAALAPIGDTQILIGAPLEDTDGADAGAAYLYDLTTPTPTLLKRFARPASPAPVAGAQFGSAVATSAIFATLAIGAPGDDADGTDSGAVYTFAGSAPYAAQQRIPNPDAAAGDRFGAALLAYAKGFVPYWAIGAPNDAGTGTVREYAVGSTTPDDPTPLTGSAGSLFGYSIAIGPTIASQLHFLVGAPGASSAAGEVRLVNEVTHAAVKTFTRPGGGNVFDLFGFAVGRLNGNFVIGTPGADVGATDAGAVYVFASSGAYPLVDTIPNPSPGAGDVFGFSVAGPNRLVVGARGNDVTPPDESGGAYLFEPAFSTACWTSGAASAIGSWDPPKSWPSVAVHMILLHTADHKGKVLFFQGFGNGRGYLWDPVTQAVTNVGTIPGPDIFCAGHATLKDGRALLMGGTNLFGGGGTTNAVTFDGGTQLFTSEQTMTYQRFYPTATTLGDGRVLATEGTTTTPEPHQTTPELFDPALGCWRKLTPSPVVKMETYPFMFLLPDGKIFQAGRSIVGGGTLPPVTTPITRKLTLSIPDAACTTDGSATWTTVSTSTIDGAEGSAVLYRATEHSGANITTASKVLKAGGMHLGDPTALADAIDIAATNTWSSAASMNVARAHPNLVALPNGEVLAVGGTSEEADAGYPGVVLGVETWDPNAGAGGTWTKRACMAEPRMYHSTALLLPDGSVLSAGGGPLVDGAGLTVYPSFEVYRPPYMFASRPQIVASSVPAQAAFFGSFDVDVTNAAASEIDTVAFIRPGAVTHSFDHNQRYVAASFSVKDANTITVNTPANNKVAPAGYYMLFVVKDGAPSSAVFVRLDGGGCG
jgi:hypothetical protein